jgi:hypothetical protein
MKLKHFSMRHFKMFRLFASIGAGGSAPYYQILWRRRRRI